MNSMRTFRAARLAIAAAMALSLLHRAWAAPPETKTSKPADKAPAAVSMFDGKTLAGWKVTDFGGHGDVKVVDGTIRLEMGVALTGITWTKDFPKVDYEVTLEAMRVDGDDFFCGMTFPVNDKPCSLIVGGWGGSVVGLSSVDGADASENETTGYFTYAKGQWYPVRLRVTKNKIEAWVGKDKVADLDYTDRDLSIRFEVEPSRPFGIASWCTTAALRNVKLRRL